VHRIGRTGRAGRSGIALSFVCEDQSYLVRDIEKLVGRSLEPAGTQAQVKKPSLAARRFRSGGRRRIV
jgi:superfamily II DNA/RNA helicase